MFNDLEAIAIKLIENEAETERTEFQWNMGQIEKLNIYSIEVPESEVEKLFEEVMTNISPQTQGQLSAHISKKLNEPKHREYTSAHYKKIIYHQR